MKKNCGAYTVSYNNEKDVWEASEIESEPILSRPTRKEAEAAMEARLEKAKKEKKKKFERIKAFTTGRYSNKDTYIMGYVTSITEERDYLGGLYVWFVSDSGSKEKRVSKNVYLATEENLKAMERCNSLNAQIAELQKERDSVKFECLKIEEAL